MHLLPGAPADGGTAATATTPRGATAVVGSFVCAAVTDVHGHVVFESADMQVVVSESYRVIVDANTKCRSAEIFDFKPRSRYVEVSPLVKRVGIDVRIAASYSRSGTAHWSRDLPLPESIPFNLFHRMHSSGDSKAVYSSATKADPNEPLYNNTKLVEASADVLYVGESYVIEMAPQSHYLMPASREFTVTSESDQRIEIPLERKIGRIQVHLHPSERRGLPLPPNIVLGLKHAGLGLRVMEPLPVGSDRAQLYGEETLLIGERYELTASAGDMLYPNSIEFTVQTEPTEVNLILERRSTEAQLLFRPSAPPLSKPQPTRGGGAASVSWEGNAAAAAAAQARDAQWAADLEIPEGLVYEVWHAASGKRITTGAATGGQQPSAVLEEGVVFVGETYVLNVLPGFGLQGGRCEFYVRSAERQEVVLQVQRAVCAMRVALVPFAPHKRHWANSLPLPRHIGFELVHKTTGTVVYRGDAGPTNKRSLSAGEVQLFTGEKYLLQSLSSAPVLAARTEFVVAPSSSASHRVNSGIAKFLGEESTLLGAHDDGVQEVVLPIERSVGDVRLILKSVDNRHLPARVPYIVRHQNGSVVIEGKTTNAGREVECDLWFVNEGALYVGETYTFIVPRGNGFVETAKQFVVGGDGLSSAAMAGSAGTKSLAMQHDSGPTVVELDLTREYASAMVRLLSDKAGTSHWASSLPLPLSMTLYVRPASDFSNIVGHKIVDNTERSQEAAVPLHEGLQIVAHTEYLIELQQAATHQRSSGQLVTKTAALTSRAEIKVTRIAKPAILLLLRAMDGVNLPGGMNIKIKHADLEGQPLVAESTTTESAAEFAVPSPSRTPSTSVSTILQRWRVRRVLAVLKAIDLRSPIVWMTSCLT